MTARRPKPIHAKLRTNRGLAIDPKWRVVVDRYRLVDPTHRFPKTNFVEIEADPILILETPFRTDRIVGEVSLTPQGKKIFALVVFKRKNFEIPFSTTVLETLDDFLARLETAASKSASPRHARGPHIRNTTQA